jgi:hypothetical protein
MLPNFVIAGVNKAGTTSLFTYLAHHPDVCPSLVKETGYFLPLRYRERMDDIAVYEGLFSNYADQKIVMEATPGYFYGGDELAARMQKILGNVSVLIILREPLERFISFFRFMKSSLLIPADMSFKAYFEVCARQTPDMLRKRKNNPYFGLEGGCYSRYLPAWQERFGSRLKILFFDDLCKDPKIVLQETSRFLDIDESYFESVGFDIENKTFSYKSRVFHSLALRLNRTMETALRKSPHIKKVLRTIYCRLNTTDPDEVIDTATVESVKLYYQPYKENLGSFLAENDGVSMPPWLTQKN